MSGLSDKDFIAAFIKMLQWAITNILKTNEKNTKSQQRNKRYKELNKNFRKNIIEILKKKDELNSIMD